MRPDALALGLLLMLGCSRPTGQPVPVAEGRVTCDFCHMTVEVERRAAEIVPAVGTPKFFDEAGCLMRCVAMARTIGPDDRLWVHDEAGGAWIDARTAVFVIGAQPPAGMMYGVLAYADRAQAEAARGEGRAVDYATYLAELRR